MIKKLNTKGEITSKELMITGAITIGLAIIIIIVFIVLSGSKETGTSQETQDLINQIKNQGQGQDDEYSDDDSRDTQDEDKIETIKYAGKLIEIEGNTLTILENLEQENISFDIPKNTTITSSGEEFEFSDLHIGDSLEIITEKDKNKTTVIEIKIKLSTSPTVPTKVDIPTNTPGAILPPSQRQAL
jgi:hypothetical protein